MTERPSALRHIVAYVGVAVASKLVPLASILVFSRMMTVPDYGVVNLFSSYIWILGIACSLNLYTAIGRWAYDEHTDLGRLLGTSLISVGGLFAVASVAVALRLDASAALLKLPSATIPLLLVVVLGQIAESLLTQVAIFREQSGLLLRVTSGRAVATLALSLALLVMLDEEKYLGVLLADAVTSAVLVLYVAVSLGRRATWTFDRPIFRAMARYSIPLIPYMLSLTLLSQVDRIMIDRLYGKEPTGLYSMAYNVGILIVVVMSAVLNAYNPRFFEAMNRRDWQRVADDSRVVWSAALLCTGALVCVGPDLAALMLPAKYAPCFSLIPPIALGGLASVIFQIWGRVIGFANRTHLSSLIAVAATAVKLGLNAWLLPSQGFQVAALTTIAAYLAMSLLCIAVVNHVVKLAPARVAHELIGLLTLSAVAAVLHAAELAPLPAAALKAAVLLALVWIERPRLRALLSLRRGGATT